MSDGVNRACFAAICGFAQDDGHGSQRSAGNLAGGRISPGCGIFHARGHGGQSRPCALDRGCLGHHSLPAALSGDAVWAAYALCVVRRIPVLLPLPEMATLELAPALAGTSCCLSLCGAGLIEMEAEGACPIGRGGAGRFGFRRRPERFAAAGGPRMEHVHGEANRTVLRQRVPAQQCLRAVHFVEERGFGTSACS